MFKTRGGRAAEIWYLCPRCFLRIRASAAVSSDISAQMSIYNDKNKRILSLSWAVAIVCWEFEPVPLRRQFLRCGTCPPLFKTGHMVLLLFISNLYIYIYIYGISTWKFFFKVNNASSYKKKFNLIKFYLSSWSSFRASLCSSSVTENLEIYEKKKLWTALW